MLLVCVDDRFCEHVPGAGHPERPQRLHAVRDALDGLGLLSDATVRIEARFATRSELELVHPCDHLDLLERVAIRGGGQLDADTAMSAGSWDAARLAAGSGLGAIEALESGRGSAAFLAIRPPGHHALGARAMGFCLLNNLAITAAALAARGERVAILDWDAHHGNGTQDIFWADSNVLYISLHQSPLYPGTGAIDERGVGAGFATTINVPLPPGATGDVYLNAFDHVIAPACERFGATWLLVSAGFDAHRNDPLTDLGLSAADFADLTARAMQLVPAGRLVCFLEGGYDLDALRASVTATASTLMGRAERVDHATIGGPGADVVTRVRRVHDLD